VSDNRPVTELSGAQMTRPDTRLVEPRAGRRCVVMGVLNVTDDSFSDGGLYYDRDTAVDRGLELYRLGADIVDVGGESTRPGAHRVDSAVELERVIPVITKLAAAGVPTSIDTMRARVAAAAIEAGVTIVNDVSGGRADADMAGVVAAAGVPWILMHWRAVPDYRHVGTAAHYDDVVDDVLTELGRQIDLAVTAGVRPERIVLDPGLGFAKAAADDWTLLGAIPQLAATGFPILVGASRKRFLGRLLGSNDARSTPEHYRTEPVGDEPPMRPPTGREVATAAVSALAATNGAWGVRVHDVTASLDAIAVADAWAAARENQRKRRSQ
jgi:dihydropteroate synthase